MGELFHLGEEVGEEEGDPDGFALAGSADGGEAVVPVAAADEGEAMGSEARESAVDGAAEVFVEGCLLSALVVVYAAFGYAGGKGLGVAEGHLFGEDGGVAGDGDVLVGDEEEPEVVVGEGGAGAEACVPPVEDIAFGELVCGVEEDLAASVGGVGVEERHDILELVAETGGAADLVEAGTGEEAGGIDLIEVPAVDHVVEGAVGGFDLDGGEFAVPVVDDAFEFGVDEVESGEVRFRFSV